MNHFKKFYGCLPHYIKVPAVGKEASTRTVRNSAMEKQLNWELQLAPPPQPVFCWMCESKIWWYYECLIWWCNFLSTSWFSIGIKLEMIFSALHGNSSCWLKEASPVNFYQNFWNPNLMMLCCISMSLSIYLSRYLVIYLNIYVSLSFLPTYHIFLSFSSYYFTLTCYVFNKRIHSKQKEWHS